MPVRPFHRLAGLTLGLTLLLTGAATAAPALAEDAPPTAVPDSGSGKAQRTDVPQVQAATAALKDARERKLQNRPTAAGSAGGTALHGTIDVPSGVLDPDSDLSAVFLASPDGAEYLGASPIDANGGYAFSDVEPGDYVLIASGLCECAGGWFSQLLLTKSGAATVAVADGVDTAWDTAMAVPDAQITGRATGLLDSFDAESVPFPYTKAEGRWIELDAGGVLEGPLSSRPYVLPMLRSGEYTLGLVEGTPMTGIERSAWFGGGAALQSAKSITVAGGETRTGADLGFSGRPVVNEKNFAAKRLSGGDRFETSAAVSRASFPRGASTAYIANGLAFPDALAGAAAAGAGNAPVLLVRPGSIPASVRAELKRLQPDEIVVLGSTGAVSVAVQLELEHYADYAVRRMAGVDRFETAAAISRKTNEPGVPAVYVSSGLDFPDALAGAAAAGAAGAPVLLVRPGSIPASVQAELKRLQPEQIFVLGGPGAVSRGVESQLGRYASSGVERLAGPDRFSTAAAVSASMFESDSPIVYVADGMNFPDALAGAAAAGSKGGPVLLVRSGSIPSATATELSRLRPQRIVVLGGPGAINPAVQAQLKRYLSP